ncbi:MAG: hypothetical protein M1829_002995 [Trizodia sp. TS-e1964]|nr:MAG: hypothetical protein M1829_002995 [Trizodia sp. TS-e1964]
MNSVQNGIPLNASLNEFLPSYFLSINPQVCAAPYTAVYLPLKWLTSSDYQGHQNGHKVDCFSGTIRVCDGKAMLSNPAAPLERQASGELLEHHFRMCVLGVYLG